MPGVPWIRLRAAELHDGHRNRGDADQDDQQHAVDEAAGQQSPDQPEPERLRGRFDGHETFAQAVGAAEQARDEGRG